MKVTPKSVTPAKPAAPSGTTSTTKGLNPQQKTNYAQKLIGMDVAAEKARVQKLKQEATAEKATQPAKSAQLIAIANDRLALIAAEQKDRSTLATSKLSDGRTGAQFAESVKATHTPTLAQQRNALVAQVKAGTPKDAPVKLLAVTRELTRRVAENRAATQAKEAARLETVKQKYTDSLSGKTGAQLTAEKKAEQGRLDAAAKALAAAHQQLANASTPQQKTAANAAVATAEKAMRDEYAKSAVIDEKAPITWDHQLLHDYANTLKTKSLSALRTERKSVQAEYDNLNSGALRGSRQQLENDRVKLAILDAAISKKAPAPVGPVKPLDPTRNPGNVVFDGPGMFVDNAAGYSAAANADKLKAAGVTWITLQIHNGGNERSDNEAALMNGWADAWRAKGFKVGFWGVSYGNAENDGRLAAQLTAKYHGDFYNADCEGPFQSGEGDPARNKQFVDAFQDEANKEGIGKIPRSLTSMGRVALDMKPWIDNGWDAMPQAYWNDWKVYQPSLCVKFYEDSGWPKDRIHPLIGTYGATGDQTEPKQIKDYVADLKAGGTTGISYYLPENYLDENEYQQLLDGMKNGMNGPAH
ncbi:MAG: hypothetical protein ACJ790_08280 [Myxococcaceae bacterium]